MTEPARAVFVSYASQDQAPARRICDALRAAGLEVWFDQSELRGGDVWDATIRRQIKACALFVPVISRNTHARDEGYFRLEWKLAVDRSHLMTMDRAFFVPVVIDDTREDDDRVPDKFREVQWTRLPGGEASPEFVARIARLLLSPEQVPQQVASAAGAVVNRAAGASSSAGSEAGNPPRRPARAKSSLPWLAASLALVVVAALVAVRLLASKPTAAPATPAAVSAAAAPGVAEKSIAVLPFVNMSPDKEQDYFADGLAEELLDLLAKTPGLHVIARTSSFSFKGKSDDIPTIAAKLKVANILEGSVRKSGNRLRVTTQLVRATDGEHLWSETYDRELKDVFKVQDEIAGAVVAALKLRLSSAQASSPSRSANTDAYFQYLLGQQHLDRSNVDDYRLALEAYRKAVALDPHYAAAYAGLALAENYVADATGDNAGLERSKAAAEHAVELAPDEAMGYAARGWVDSTFWQWDLARADFERAIALDPNEPVVLRRYAILLGYLGRLSEAAVMARKAAELDPFSAPAWQVLDSILIERQQFAAAREANHNALAIDPQRHYTLYDLGTLELLVRQPAQALAAFHRIAGEDPDAVGFRASGIAMAEHSLGHARESQQALDEAISKAAEVSAYQIAQAIAWRGETDKAFAWLERAYRQRDGGLAFVKADPLLDSLHGDARYGALLRKLNLPE